MKAVERFWPVCARIVLPILILIIPFSTPAVGGCLITEALKDPRLATNPQFWDDYARLTNSKLTTENEVDSLIKKYKIAAPEAPTATAQFNPSKSFKIQHKAEKEIEQLPQNLRQKVDEFISIATTPNGLNELFNNPGRWHFEKLPQFGDKAHSVRLNDGYRILFDVVDGEVNVRRVNKGQIHGN